MSHILNRSPVIHLTAAAPPWLPPHGFRMIVTNRSMNIPLEQPVVVVLAGGLAQRMGGGDKGLHPVDGTPILQGIVALARRWSGDRVLLSANGDPDRFQHLAWLRDVPILADGVPDRPGPLAGILAAMDWATAHVPGCNHILSVPCDTPFLPADLCPRLCVSTVETRVVMAQGPDGSRQPTIALWPLSLRPALYHALTQEHLRKVGAFADRHGVTTIPFPPGPGGVDPFFNVNGPDDLIAAQNLPDHS